MAFPEGFEWKNNHSEWGRKYDLVWLLDFLPLYVVSRSLLFLCWLLLEKDLLRILT
jgi:hypothetical protein